MIIRYWRIKVKLLNSNFRGRALTSSINDLIVNASATLTYLLPEIEDPDAEDISINVNLKSTLSFAIYDISTQALIFKP